LIKQSLKESGGQSLTPLFQALIESIIQRGNNRQACFTSKQDFIAYSGWLKDYSQKSSMISVRQPTKAWQLAIGN